MNKENIESEKNLSFFLVKKERARETNIKFLIQIEREGVIINFTVKEREKLI